LDRCRTDKAVVESGVLRGGSGTMSDAVIAFIIGLFIGVLIGDTMAIMMLCYKIAKLEQNAGKR